MYKESQTKGSHIPLVYDDHYFQLYIAGYRWAFPTIVRSFHVHATLSIKFENEPDFELLCTTERDNDVTCLNFIQRAYFSPMQEPNFKERISNATLRLQVFINSIAYSNFQFPFRKLLAHQYWSADMPSFEPKYYTRKKRGNGCVSVGVVRGKHIHSEQTEKTVNFHIKLTPALWKRLQEPKIKIAVSTVAEKGGWTRLYISKDIRRPWQSGKETDITGISISRDELVGHNANNPIRIEMYTVQKNDVKLKLGFVQASLKTFERQNHVNWTMTKYGYVTPCISVTGWSEEEDKINVHLTWGRAGGEDDGNKTTDKQGGLLRRFREPRISRAKTVDGSGGKPVSVNEISTSFPSVHSDVGNGKDSQEIHEAMVMFPGDQCLARVEETADDVETQFPELVSMELPISFATDDEPKSIRW